MEQLTVEQRIELISKAVLGISNNEWKAIKTSIDKIFNSEVAKVQLNDSERLAKLLKLELTQ